MRWYWMMWRSYSCAPSPEYSVAIASKVFWGTRCSAVAVEIAQVIKRRASASDAKILMRGRVQQREACMHRADYARRSLEPWVWQVFKVSIRKNAIQVCSGRIAPGSRTRHADI